MTDGPTEKTTRRRGTAEAKAAAELPTWLISGDLTRRTHFVLAHGAGAGMTSPVLTRMTDLLNEGGVTVHRFEFFYMAARTAGGTKRPAPRGETLIGEYQAAIADCRSRIGSQARLFIGGKSMGGRIACLAAAAGADVDGVAVLGFPLVPPGKPDASRARVIETSTTPTLIVQGTRDAFGGPEAFAEVRVPACVTMHWIADGDHDLKPRKVSGRTPDEVLRDAAGAILRFFLLPAS